jgi:hypothetical protein
VRRRRVSSDVQLVDRSEYRAIDPDRELLAGPGQGMPLFRRHFAAFRSLVAATALGTAAGVHTMVAGMLVARARIGVLPRVRDSRERRGACLRV